MNPLSSVPSGGGGRGTGAGAGHGTAPGQHPASPSATPTSERHRGSAADPGAATGITAAVDHLLTPLFGRLPGQFDLLLDLRRHLIERDQPGSCVRLYFQLLAQVPAWRHPELADLRDHLEHFIRLQIVLEQSRERFHTCLGLQRTGSFQDYCQLIMREAARRHRDCPELELSFDWSAA